MPYKDMTCIFFHIFFNVLNYFFSGVMMRANLLIFKTLAHCTWISVWHKMEMNFSALIRQHDRFYFSRQLTYNMVTIFAHHFTPEIQSAWTIMISRNC